MEQFSLPFFGAFDDVTFKGPCLKQEDFKEKCILPNNTNYYKCMDFR